MGLAGGSVPDPAWLSGWGAGCTQAQGRRVPLFVLPLWAFLPVPALRKPTLHLSLPSLPGAALHSHQPSSSSSTSSLFSFPASLSTSSNNGGDFC
ncbi:hypothetical protein CgunFtcFv8_004642 [Champsocephalus gunnari]|uniref:Uncharacterized protein n=1 Tax=Champsocephalus gunnari TaxID=52237 RepID=A0AAN8HZ10_CHAGU|nr:hypothetical protein CgunFtcFv8_004642 [Champsocephalus gunnari]